MAIDLRSLSSIKLLILDVDGVLTDSCIWLDSSGEWRRKFSVRDGIGIRRLIESGYQLAIITASKAEDIRMRVKNLGIQHFYEGSINKEPAFKDLQTKSGLSPKQMAYIGDDIFDIPLLEAVGFSATVPEALEEVKRIVQYTTRHPGGNGAVREVCDLIYRHGPLATTQTEAGKA
ncbi:MAG: HAD-IIIA family hydrolase [Bdellovibrionota bacterium]